MEAFTSSRVRRQLAFDDDHSNPFVPMDLTLDKILKTSESGFIYTTIESCPKSIKFEDLIIDQKYKAEKLIYKVSHCIISQYLFNFHFNCFLYILF